MAYSWYDRVPRISLQAYYMLAKCDHRYLKIITLLWSDRAESVRFLAWLVIEVKKTRQPEQLVREL